MNPRLSSLLHNRWTIPAACSAVSFGTGIAVGYFIKKRQEPDFEVLIDDTIQLTLNFDEEEEEQLPKATFVIHEDDFAAYDDKLEPYKVDEGGETSMINVFNAIDTEWDYEIECQNRTPEKPYVIHRDEFFGDEMGWDSQSTLTYYEGDHVLTDERDEYLHDPEMYVGELKFGHGSGDPNVVYIRNERLQAEYEVLRDPGTYMLDVLGSVVEVKMNDKDVKHSRSPGKFRQE